MKSTHFRDDHAEIVKHIAYGYVDDEAKNSYRLSVTNFDTVGATSLLSTVEDMARWDENFSHPSVGGPGFVWAAKPHPFNHNFTVQRYALPSRAK